MSETLTETTFEDQIATRVWLGLLDTDRENLYFVSIAARMRKFSNLTNVFIAFGASGAVVTTLGGLPPVVAICLNLLVALVAIGSESTVMLKRLQRQRVLRKSALPSHANGGDFG